MSCLLLLLVVLLLRCNSCSALLLLLRSAKMQDAKHDDTDLWHGLSQRVALEA